MEFKPDDIIEIGEQEACKRLDEVLDAVEAGAFVYITRGGERVAVILRHDIQRDDLNRP